jgi:hypothetical protein
MDQARAANAGFGHRWMESRPRKTTVFWWIVAAVVLTTIVGFTWGGWVTGNTARSMAEAAANDAVVKHLAPVCLAQFERDPAKAQKAKEFGGVPIYDRADYVEKQGWATMPGEKGPDSAVAEACAELIAK